MGRQLRDPSPPITDLGLNPLAFQPHPEVWLLVGFLVGAYVYAMRVIGPQAVPAGQPVVSRAQRGLLRGGDAACCGWRRDWPIHDIGEEYLYSVHMLQHMMLSYFLPPLALLATPDVAGRGSSSATAACYAVLQWLTKPVVAGVLFNLAVMVTHIPGVVNASVRAASPVLHYGAARDARDARRC